MPARSSDTGKFRVIQNEVYTFRGRPEKGHSTDRAAAFRRFVAHVREGFALSRHAFDDVDAPRREKGRR